MQLIQSMRRMQLLDGGTAFTPIELFDCLDDVLAWVKDLQGRYCWVNRAFLINYSPAEGTANPLDQPEQILGKTDYDLSPAFLADQFRLDDEQVLAGKRIVNRIELVSESEESPLWHMTNKIPLLDANGSIVGTAGITRRLKANDREIASESGFGPVLAHMRDQYHTAINNSQLAGIAHMSVRAFERKFLASFQLTPQKYLRKLRLRMASRALVYTHQSLVEIALRCGFADQSHFTREFRRHFGRPPREYREHYSKTAIAPVSLPFSSNAKSGPVF